MQRCMHSTLDLRGKNFTTEHTESDTEKNNLEGFCFSVNCEFIEMKIRGGTTLD